MYNATIDRSHGGKGALHLTEKARIVLGFILNYRKENSISPSVREIAIGVGFRSPASVQHYITILLSEGYIAREEGKVRSLVPLMPSAEQVLSSVAQG